MNVFVKRKSEKQQDSILFEFETRLSGFQKIYSKFKVSRNENSLCRKCLFAQSYFIKTMWLSKAVFLLYLWTLFISSIHAWKFSMQHRQLQLTQEQEDLLDECDAAIDELINTNPNINITDEALATAVEVSENDLNTCSLGEIVASLPLSDAALTGDPVEYDCSLDYADVEDGTPFNNYADACIEAGGTIFVADFVVQCNFTVPTTTAIGNISIPGNFIYGRFNFPDCVLSQDVQAACDIDLYKQSIASLLPQLADDIGSQGIEASDGSVIDIQCTVSSFDFTQFDQTDSGGSGNSTGGGSGDGTGGDSENTTVVPDTDSTTSAAAVRSRFNVHAASVAMVGPVSWWLFHSIIN
jgi:hypothetical protein